MNWLHEVGSKLIQWRRLLASAVLGIIAVFMFTHVMLGNNGWITYRQKKAEYRKLEQQLKQMDEENKRLGSEIKGLKSDPKAIEKEAREELRYAKPGEVIVLLPDQQNAQHSAQTPQPAESAHK